MTATNDTSPRTAAGRALVKYRDSGWEANLGHNVAVVEKQAIATYRYEDSTGRFIDRGAVLALLRDDKEAGGG